MRVKEMQRESEGVKERQREPRERKRVNESQSVSVIYRELKS